MTHSANKPDKKKKCIKACQDCSTACETAIQIIIQIPADFPDKFTNIFIDCQSYTKIMAEFIERDSEFSKAICEIGKNICERCKVECGKYPDVAALSNAAHECELCINSINSFVN